MIFNSFAAISMSSTFSMVRVRKDDEEPTSSSQKIEGVNVTVLVSLINLVFAEESVD